MQSYVASFFLKCLLYLILISFLLGMLRVAVIPRDKPAAKGTFKGKIKHFIIKVNMSIWCATNTSNHNKDSDQL